MIQQKLNFFISITVMSLGARINDLPRELQREILQYIDDISLVILRSIIFATPMQFTVHLWSRPVVYTSGINFFKWIWNYDTNRDFVDCYAAASIGDPEIVNFLVVHLGKKDRIFNGLVAGGHLELLKWARTKGLSWNRITLGLATECGHLDIVKWLLFGTGVESPDSLGEHCPCDTMACAGGSSRWPLRSVEMA
jgi:hypothetical protein